jgi:hypothetical protein
MLEGGGGHTATLLTDGTVLVAGGVDRAGNAIATTQIFDPRRVSWTAGPTLVQARQSGIAVTLADRRILLAGGIGLGGGPLSAAEVYGPT